MAISGGTVSATCSVTPDWPHVERDPSRARKTDQASSALTFSRPLLPPLSDLRPQGSELSLQRLDLSLLLPRPPLEGLDGKQVHAVDIRGGDSGVAFETLPSAPRKAPVGPRCRILGACAL